jgi:Ca2+-binding RTX toxin-like protein
MATTIDISGYANGSYTIADDGAAGNGMSAVIRSDGTIIATFSHSDGDITILSRAGQSLSLNITDPLNTANFTVGSLSNAAASPDSITVDNIQTSGIVTLVARETIMEAGSDAATDISAGGVVLLAGSGIGAAANALETKVATLEAQTNTGGIALSNIGDVQIGGLTPSVSGLNTSTAGDISLTNQGSITLQDTNGIASVHSSGNLALTASGADADISSISTFDSIVVTGDISLSAERDVSFGTVGTDADNDVRAGGSITIQAGRDFTIDGFADLASNDMGLGTNGGVSVIAGRNINIQDSHGVDASVGAGTAGSGALTLTTGVGGTLAVTANSAAAMFAGSGGVSLNTDRLIIDSGSGITATGGGSVSISTVTSGKDIILGSTTDGSTALEISNAELDRISSDHVVIRSTTGGSVTVSDAISSPSRILEISSGQDIDLQGSVSAGQSVILQAGGDISQTSGSTISTGSVIVRVDTPDTDAAGGSLTLGGTITASSVKIFGNADADLLSGSTGDNEFTGGGGVDQFAFSANFGHDTITDLDTATELLRFDPSVFATAAEVLAAMSQSGSDTVITQGANSVTLIGVDASTVTGRNIDIAGVNDAPVTAAAAESNTGTEDNAITGTLLTGYDVDSGTLIFAPGAARTVGGTVVINPTTGAYTFTPAANFNGVAAFTYVLSDGDKQSVEKTVTLTIAGANDAPVGEPVIQGVAAEGKTLTVADQFSDADGVGSVVHQWQRSFDGGISWANVGTGSTYKLGEADIGAEVRVVASFADGSGTLETLTSEKTKLVAADDNDLIIGTAGDDWLDGGQGIDTLFGGAGNDVYVVDLASDQVIEYRGEGIDTVRSSASFMLTNGNVENLVLTGNAIYGYGNGLANQMYASGTGSLLHGWGGNDSLYGGAGQDRLHGGSGDDRLYGRDGDDRLNGGSGKDRLDGGAGRDYLAGESGNDVLKGGDGNDTISAGTGNDVIYGGRGSDHLYGSYGRDAFVFDTRLGKGEVDTIHGFNVEDDTVRLENAVFTKVGGKGWLNADAFHIGSHAADAADRIIYDTAKGVLYYDSDGAGGHDQVAFAKLSKGLALTERDFYIV